MRRVFLVTVFAGLALAGCGGGASDSTTTTEATGPASPAVVAKADAVCQEMIDDARRMGAEFTETTPESDPLTFTTEELVKPAVGILEESARKLRALQPKAESATFDAYVALYDPILALARDRVATGHAGDEGRAHELELQMVELSELQRPLARSAGLKTCDVDFFEAFTTPSASG
jgi:hypothetical protein